MVDPLRRLRQTLQHLPNPASAQPGIREAAVALILAPGPDRVLLIRRAERPGDPWSGHLALPGGRREPSDADLLTTAIRETREEVQIELDRAECCARLGDLGPVSPTLPPLVVRPFVFLLPEPRVAGASEEVDEATWVPLATLATPGVFQSRRLHLAGADRDVPGYLLTQGFLWGMTERMITPVLRAWQRVPSID